MVIELLPVFITGNYTFTQNVPPGTPITDVTQVQVIVSLNGVVVGIANVNLALATIPTMSEWGLMIFGLLILNMSVVFLRRREELLVIEGA